VKRVVLHQPRAANEVDEQSPSTCFLSADGRSCRSGAVHIYEYFKRKNSLSSNWKESVAVRIDSLGLLVVEKGKLEHLQVFLLARLLDI
jgi:hypothetical protein